MTAQDSRLWDLPVRLTHWLLVAGVVAGWATYESDLMDWHMRNGYAVLTLVLFRILWGLAGSSSARFAQFLTSPAAALAYLREGSGRRWPGHSPIGGWATLALLAAVGVQAATGLFADDDLLTSGPLVHLVSEELSEALSEFHEIWYFLGLGGVVAIHLGAIAFYRLRKGQNLVTPMITGRAPLDPVDAASLRFAPLGLAAALLGVSACAVWALVTLV